MFVLYILYKYILKIERFSFALATGKWVSDDAAYTVHHVTSVQLDSTQQDNTAENSVKRQRQQKTAIPPRFVKIRWVSS